MTTAVQTPPVETPEQREASRMMQEYLTGDADAAVAYFARLPPDNPANPYPSIGWLASDLLTTEVSMQRRTFGKYARSAPIETVKDGIVGFNGAFEMTSWLLYRSLDYELHRVRNEVSPGVRDLRQPSQTSPPVDTSKPPVPPEARALVERFFREWHVITISHCMRWQLDCAETLLASAKERFPGSPDVLLLEAAAAESHNQPTLALPLLRQAVRADPNNVAAELRFGRLLVAQQQATEGERALERALTVARSAHHDASRYLALQALADLDRRAGRTTHAAERLAEASTIRPFAKPLFASLTPTDIYRAGVFYEQPRRLAALRELVRAQGPR